MPNFDLKKTYDKKRLKTTINNPKTIINNPKTTHMLFRVRNVFRVLVETYLKKSNSQKSVTRKNSAVLSG